MPIENFNTYFNSYEGISELIKNYSDVDIVSQIVSITNTDTNTLLHYPMGCYSKSNTNAVYLDSLNDLKKNILYYDQVYQLLADDMSKNIFTSLIRYHLVPDAQFTRIASEQKNPQLTNRNFTTFNKEIGSEIPNLLANKEFIKDTTPEFSITVHYRITDLWEIPLLIHYINPNYTYYLQHIISEQKSETILYSLPKNTISKKQDKKKQKVIAAFPWREGWTNVELTKDCGLIPYLLYKNHNATVTMIGKQMEPYSYLDTYVNGLQMHLLETGSVYEKNQYILEHGKEIDCILLRGAYNTNINLAINYKKVNPNGKIYMGLDANSHWMDRILWQEEPFIQMMNCCDVIATSCKALQKHLNEKWPWKIEYIPNGYYNFGIQRPAPSFSKKENIILTVSRLGTPQKATHILLEAFALIAHKLPHWKLRLIGSIEDSFKEYIENFFQKYPHLSSQIEFMGVISDKNRLFEEYLKSKIFTLTSTFEGGTPNVVSEALTAGCVMAVTKFDAWEDAIDEGRCGMAAEINNIPEIAVMLLKLCQDSNLKQLSENAYQHALRTYTMEHIVAKLYEMLFGGDFI